MNASSEQATLQSLSESLGPNTLDNISKLTPEQIKNISNKLNQMLGAGDTQVVNQNEKGEILNEEGLPIIDISENLAGESSAVASPSEPLAQERLGILPLWTLPSVEIQRRRAERDRILDNLEEEERIDKEEEEQREEKERQKALQKRRDAAKKHFHGFKAAREMQKKMGQALVRGLAEMKEQEDTKKNQQPIHNTEAEQVRKNLKLGKSVTFALPTEEAGEPKETPITLGSEAAFDWGDVVPARLQKLKPISSPYTTSHGPMKRTVIERRPGASVHVDTSPEKDSDNESVLPAPSDSSDEGISISQLNNPEGEVDGTSEEEEGVGLLDDEFDLDAAQHQREIALAYYEKRNKIGAQAAVALTSHTHDPDEDPWDRPEVPLEASLTGDRPKPPVSRFRSDRLVSASTSLDGSIVPVSKSHIVQRAVRQGKIMEGKLVGGDDVDSDDEDMVEISELLRRGDIENAGPATAPPNYNLAASQSQGVVEPKPDSKPRVKTSKFKLARKGELDLVSSPTTPVSEVGRSSPKLPVSDIVVERGVIQPGLVSTVTSQSQQRTSDMMLKSQTVRVGRSSPKLPVSQYIVERTVEREPTLPSRGHPITVLTTSPRVRERVSNAGGPSLQQPMIIDSPSFTPLPTSSQPEPPSVKSCSAPTSSAFLVDSPSFQPPTDREAVLNLSQTTVMSNEVREAAYPRVSAGYGKGKKVSKFSADRM